jgi:membrane peptidoglycan carboxypeptidase
MNKIYYSDGVTGIKAAAKYYFNKDMKDLNLAEEAYLAGLPQVPNLYNYSYRLGIFHLCCTLVLIYKKDKLLVLYDR